MNNAEMTSFTQLEVPVAVKHILQKLNWEQLARGRKEIAEQLELIRNKVETLLYCSAQVDEIEKEPQSEQSWKEDVDGTQQRTILLDKLTNMLNSSAQIQWNLEQVLLWLSGICSRDETQANMTEVNTDQWITEKEKELSSCLDFLLQCLAKLTKVTSIISDVEVPTVQQNKDAPKDGFSGQQWGKRNAKIKDITALSLKKMMEDEDCVVVESAELLKLLQDFITTSLCNREDHAVFHYILQMFSTLSMAFSLRSKEFHEMEKENKAKEAQVVNLNAMCADLSTEIKGLQENITTLEMCLHDAEAKTEPSIDSGRQCMAQVDKKPLKLVDRSQQCDQVLYADSETQTLDLMNTGELEGEYTLPTDFQSHNVIYTEIENVYNEENPYWELFSAEKDPSLHEQFSENSNLSETDTNNLPQFLQSHKDGIGVEIQIKQKNLGELFQEHEKMFPCPTKAPDPCDLIDVPLPVNQEQPMSTDLDFCVQSDDDQLMAVREFQQAVNYLLDYKLSCVGMKNEENMEKNIPENVMLHHLHPAVQSLYQETKAKIEDVFMKVNEKTLEQDVKRHIQENNITVLSTAIQDTDKPHQPEVLTAQFNKVLQNDRNLSMDNKLLGSTISKTSSSLIPLGDIKKGQQRSGNFKGHEAEMDTLYKHIFPELPENQALEQPSKWNLYSEQMDHDPLLQVQKKDSTEKYSTRQRSYQNLKYSDSVEATEHYVMDMKLQRTNLKILKKAEILGTISPHLQSLAMDLIHQTSEVVLTRLGNLFNKYIAFHLIQNVR
ncbi:protein FAM186B [Pyxicephalus adspersus]